MRLVMIMIWRDGEVQIWGEAREQAGTYLPKQSCQHLSFPGAGTRREVAAPSHLPCLTDSWTTRRGVAGLQ